MTDMKLFNNEKGLSFFKLLGIIWIVFATLYVVYGEYSRLQNYVAVSAYNSGMSDAVYKLVQESSDCRPVPVVAGDIQMQFINVECLTPADNTPDGPTNL